MNDQIEEQHVQPEMEADEGDDAPEPNRLQIPLWQMFFLYPAFGVAFLTAVPTWADKFQEIYHDLKTVSIEQARYNDKLMRSNVSCMTAPTRWTENPNKVLIDGHICDSGDVFLRIRIPDETIANELGLGVPGEHFKFIGMKQLLDEYRSVLPGVNVASALGLRAAFAATPIPLNKGQNPSSSLPLPVQDQFVITLCQRFEGERTLVRHVQVGQQCFDERVDTFTGALISRLQVPCNPSCN